MPAEDPRVEVLLLTVDAGGGHRAASRALVAAAESRGAPFRLRVESVQELLASFDILGRLFGLRVEEGYNLLLRRHWTRLMPPLLRLLHGVIGLRHPFMSEDLARHLRRWRPAAVVSVAPNFNGVIRDAVREACPGTPFIVVLTDYADFPPHFWIEPGLTRVVVGSDRAAEQALTIGLTREQTTRASGMILHPRFYPRATAADRLRLRAEFGLAPDDFVVLLLFGGKGSPEMVPLAEALLRRQARRKVVAICGHNPSLYDRLASVEEHAAGSLLRVGFTDRVADYLAVSDLLVSKPGPGVLAEAFHQGVPAVVIRNHTTIPQERYNAEWVDEAGLGKVVADWSAIPAVVEDFETRPQVLREFRQRVAALPDNRAVFEVLDVIAREIDLARDSSRCPPRQG